MTTNSAGYAGESRICVWWVAGRIRCSEDSGDGTRTTGWKLSDKASAGDGTDGVRAGVHGAPGPGSVWRVADMPQLLGSAALGFPASRYSCPSPLTSRFALRTGPGHIRGRLAS
jgi:hypothetical protein